MARCSRNPAYESACERSVRPCQMRQTIALPPNLPECQSDSWDLAIHRHITPPVVRPWPAPLVPYAIKPKRSTRGRGKLTNTIGRNEAMAILGCPTSAQPLLPWMDLFRRLALQTVQRQCK